MRDAILIFAKAPVPGRVKTRLVPPLTAASAAQLYRALTDDVLETVCSLRDRAAVELHTDVTTRAWSAYDVPHRLQRGDDLGARMWNALDDALSRGYEQVLIAGSDAPTLPREHIAALLASRADVTLGPACDGGYWGIACRRIDPRMFDGVPWSAPGTLERTAASVTAAALSVNFGPRWYDVDDAAGLERLRADPALGRHTAAVLRTVL